MKEDAFNHSRTCSSQHFQLYCFELSKPPHGIICTSLLAATSPSFISLHQSLFLLSSSSSFRLLLSSHIRGRYFNLIYHFFFFFKAKNPYLETSRPIKMRTSGGFVSGGQAASPTHCYVPSVLKAGKEVWDLMRFKCVWIKNLSQQASLLGSRNTVHVSSC